MLRAAPRSRNQTARNSCSRLHLFLGEQVPCLSSQCQAWRAQRWHPSCFSPGMMSMAGGVRVLGLVALTTGLAGIGVGTPRVGGEGPTPSPTPGLMPTATATPDRMRTPTPQPTATSDPIATPTPDPRPDRLGTPQDQVDGASRDLAAKVVRLSSRADAVDRLWQVYRARCAPGTTKGYEFGREWFGLWDRAFVSTTGDAGCAALLQRVVVDGGGVLMELTAAAALARHAGVSPLTIHGMVRWNGLEWQPLTAAAANQTAALR